MAMHYDVCSVKEDILVYSHYCFIPDAQISAWHIVDVP